MLVRGLPAAVHDIEPFISARIAVVVRVEVETVFRGFLGPPARNDIERETAVRDPVDVGGLLGEQSRARALRRL